jgi:hypothetical protein
VLLLPFALALAFSYQGGLETQRSYAPLVGPGPFTTETSFDGFGQPVAQTTQAGAAGGVSPLFELAVVREVKGRVASLQWAFAPPQSDTPQARARPWRGYTYDARARLETSYEDFGVGAFVDTSSLVQGEVTRGQVQGLGAGKDEWAYGRELSGSTLSISNQRTGDSRFALRRDRDLGYQRVRKAAGHHASPLRNSPAVALPH